MIIHSKIQSVTVYKDRAIVERFAQSILETGEHQLIFSGLPQGIDPNSIQVNGSKNTILQDIKLTDVYHSETPDEEKKSIIEEMEEIESKILELNDRITNTNLEKSFLQNLVSLSGESSKKSVIAMFMPEKLQDMLRFYSEKLNTLDDTIRNYNKEIKKANNHLNLLKHEFNKFNKNQLKAEKQLALKVNILVKGQINILISYVVMNASWSPTYDLRLNSEEKKLGIAYNAVVFQNTGENWDQVNLKLSTARPQVSARTPLLNPWYINVFQYPQSPSMSSISISDEEESIDRSMKKKEKGKDLFAGAPMKIPVAQVETGATSVIFAIPGLCSISDNNEEHRIGITSLEFSANLEYNSVPKISPFAYLTATASNNSDFPLLAGKTNIFLDNSFVANSMLKLVAPNEEFDTSLGIDEGIKIEHKLVNKFTKDEGLFSKKIKITFEYLIEVKNNKKIPCLIKIKDQLPVSQNQEIKIEWIEPRYKEDTETLKKEIDGSIEWKQNLNPDEKIKLGLKFSVEYPKDIVINGLE